jgi:hypothetical protein
MTGDQREVEWSDSATALVGDTVSVLAPPPPTLWDRFLWRAFRIERRREPVLRTYRVEAIHSSGDRTEGG